MEGQFNNRALSADRNQTLKGHYGARLLTERLTTVTHIVIYSCSLWFSPSVMYDHHNHVGLVSKRIHLELAKKRLAYLQYCWQVGT